MSMANSFFYIYVLATSFFYIYVIATSFLYIYIYKLTERPVVLLNAIFVSYFGPARGAQLGPVDQNLSELSKLSN